MKLFTAVFTSSIELSLQEYRVTVQQMESKIEQLTKALNEANDEKAVSASVRGMTSSSESTQGYSARKCLV